MTMMARSRWWRGDSIENQTFGVRFGRAIRSSSTRSETRTRVSTNSARRAAVFFPNVDSGEDTLSSRARGGLSPLSPSRYGSYPPRTRRSTAASCLARLLRARRPSHVRRRRARGGHRPRRPAATSRRAWRRARASTDEATSPARGGAWRARPARRRARSCPARRTRATTACRSSRSPTPTARPS